MPTLAQAKKAWEHMNKGKPYYDAMTEEQKKAAWQYGYDRNLIDVSKLGPGARIEYQKYVDPDRPEYRPQASIVEKNPKQYYQTQNEKIMDAITPAIVKNMVSKSPEQIAADNKRRLLNEQRLESYAPPQPMKQQLPQHKNDRQNKTVVQQGKVPEKGLKRPDNPFAPAVVNFANTAMLGALERNTDAIDKLREKAPVSSTIGSMAGYLVPFGTAKGALVKGTQTLGKRMLTDAALGAGIDTATELTRGKLTPENAAKNIAIGAGAGLLADLGLTALGKIGQSIAKKLANAEKLTKAELDAIDNLPAETKQKIADVFYIDPYGNVRTKPESIGLLEAPKTDLTTPKILQREAPKTIVKSPIKPPEINSNIKPLPTEQKSLTGQIKASDNAAKDTINKIAFEPNKNKKTIKGNLETAYSKLVNNQYELSKVSKGQSASANAKVMASNARNAKGTVEYIVNNGLVDKSGRQIGKSLNEIFTVPKGKEREFEDYLLHKHNIQRMEQGKPVFGEDVTKEISKAKIATYEMMNPEFKQKADELNNFMSTLTKTWGDDLIPPELMDKIQKMYPNYVPTYREAIAAGGGNYKSKGITPGQLVKRAVGDDEQIVSLSRSIPALINKTVKAARKNEVYLSILDAIEKDPDGMRAFAKLADAKPGEGELISEAIQDEGIEGIVNRVMLEVDPKKGYYVTAMRKGKPVRMEITKDMYDALKSLDEVDMSDTGKVIDVFKKYTVDLFKGLTTGYNPVFAIRNIFRDIPTAYIYGTESNPVRFAVNLYRAAKKMKNNDALYKEYLALGGERSNFFEVNKGIRNQGKLGKIEKKLSAFNNLTETLPRFAEFMNTVEKGGGTYDSKMQGLFNAAEITVNFGRHGNVTKSIDKFVPYLNPSVQGIDKFIRTMATRPDSVIKALGVITLPTAGLYAVNQMFAKDAYNKLDNRTKDTYFVIPTGEGTFLKVPKSREIGVLFSTLFERIVRQMQGDKKAFKGLGKTVFTNFAPVNPIESNIIAPATLNIKSNKDFAGRAIVPQYMLEDKRSPYLQYDEKTSEIAKTLGKAINASPKQIDYLIKSYTGIVGSLLQPATTKGGSVTKNVITRNFIADPLYSNEILNEFYETRDKLQRIATDKNLTQKLPSKLVTPEERLRGKYDAAARDMSAIRKEIAKLQASNDPQKEQKMRDLQAKILKIAQDTMNKYKLQQ
jgi:hypothetical protein